MARRVLLGEFGEQGREAWISAALEVLASEGVDAVRVELLARKLKITKGSFYHHFKDRDELHAAMLERWMQRLVVEWIAELDRTEDPRARFAQLMRLPYGLSATDRDIDLAVLLWARRDARAAAAFERAERLRKDVIARTLAECGVPRKDANARAVLALAFLREAPKLDDSDFGVCERLLLSA
jgi:AcrR family transcriptional regulator